MKVSIKANKLISVVLLILITGGLMFSSCRRTRYRHMVKKRRAGTLKKSRHRGSYQKKLRKKTLSVESPYYIKQKKNYRRRPWYDGK